MFTPHSRVMMPHEDGLTGTIANEKGDGVFTIITDDKRVLDMGADELAPIPPIVTITTAGYTAAFYIDQRNELIETTEFSEYGPRFEQGGLCEAHRGADPDLQRSIRTSLEYLAREYATA